MILDVCNKIIKNMQMKIASIENDTDVLNQALLKIEDSFIKHESKMDQDKQTAIDDVLYEMGMDINDLMTYLTETNDGIKLLANNIAIIHDNVVE